MLIENWDSATHYYSSRLTDPKTFQPSFSSVMIQRPGHGMSLLCSVRAVPPPAITWYRLANNNTRDQIRSSDSVSMSIDSYRDGRVSFRLVIHNLTEADQARYSCNATNFLGSAESILSLQHLSEPLMVNMENSLRSMMLIQVMTLAVLTVMS